MTKLVTSEVPRAVNTNLRALSMPSRPEPEELDREEKKNDSKFPRLEQWLPSYKTFDRENVESSAKALQEIRGLKISSDGTTLFALSKVVSYASTVLSSPGKKYNKADREFVNELIELGYITKSADHRSAIDTGKIRAIVIAPLSASTLPHEIGHYTESQETEYYTGIAKDYLADLTPEARTLFEREMRLQNSKLTEDQKLRELFGRMNDPTDQIANGQRTVCVLMMPVLSKDERREVERRFDVNAKKLRGEKPETIAEIYEYLSKSRLIPGE